MDAERDAGVTRGNDFTRVFDDVGYRTLRTISIEENKTGLIGEMAPYNDDTTLRSIHAVLVASFDLFE